MTITYRSVKGSALTHEEMDANFLTLVTVDSVVIPCTGGGELTAGRINELQDGNAGYTLPAADSVAANTQLIIDQPDAYVSYEPVVTRSGSDTLTDADGSSETSITFSNTSSVRLTLISDGTSDWRM